MASALRRVLRRQRKSAERLPTVAFAEATVLPTGQAGRAAISYSLGEEPGKGIALTGLLRDPHDLVIALSIRFSPMYVR
jgi:hypothetical protein